MYITLLQQKLSAMLKILRDPQNVQYRKILSQTYGVNMPLVSRRKMAPVRRSNPDGRTRRSAPWLHFVLAKPMGSLQLLQTYRSLV
uniref:Uncharacterized protein n=1 Tax=Sphaerodactylus townsendi TaxID=933632 RepID=A0ACB8E4Y8_9SAUR